MAFFRCGGSGIPASLKSGMNSVLNKKFGTSTTYDPAGWPADVNLLGPLPVKTASGAIASFVDGADGVPVKSCSVSFLPSGGGGTPSAPVAIVGHSGITLTNKDNMSTPTHTDTYTDTFGQTIYGGSRDLTTDKASATWGYHKITSSDDIYMYNSANGWLVVTSSWSEGAMLAQSNNGGICNALPTVTTSTNMGVRFSIGNNANIYFVQTQSEMGTTLEAVKDYLDNHSIYVAYPLATPTEITGLTPHAIDTLYGDNNIYADTGTTSVEYRADIDLTLNA